MSFPSCDVDSNSGTDVYSRAGTGAHLKMAGVDRPTGGFTSSSGTPSPRGGSTFSTTSPLHPDAAAPLMRGVQVLGRNNTTAVGGCELAATMLQSALHHALKIPASPDEEREGSGKRGRGGPASAVCSALGEEDGDVGTNFAGPLQHLRVAGGLPPQLVGRPQRRSCVAAPTAQAGSCGPLTDSL